MEMPCSKRQRELIDLMAQERRIHYQEVLEIAEEVSGRRINDLGLLTWEEASEVIEELKGRRR